MVFGCEGRTWRVGVAALAALLTVSMLVAPAADLRFVPIAVAPVPGDDDDAQPEWKHARQFAAARQRPAWRGIKSTPPIGCARNRHRYAIIARVVPDRVVASTNRPLHC